jgi:battenin
LLDAASGEPSLYIRRIPPTQITLTSYFASGTGAAGLAGAFLWWEIRGLGVRIGVGLSSVRPISSVVCFVTLTSCISKVLPFVIPLTYFLLLPRPHAFSALVLPEIEDFASSRTEYAQLPVSEEDAGGAVVEPLPLTTKALSIGDKWQLLKPMIPRYMMPLCKCVIPLFS